MYPKQPKRFILFSKCCFCVPLETGCFILGYFSLILNFVISVYFVGTLFYMAFYNYDLEYLHNKVLKDGGTVPDYLDGSKIMTTVVVTILDGGLNVIWFAMSIVLLIGLHRKRPGHIKFHVSVACIRLLLSIICAFFHGPYMAHSTLVCSVEIVFSAYFILLYYSYAIMLERDQRPKNPKPVMEIIASVISKPPQHIDKVTLTEGKGNYCTV
uniref:SFRICE_010887 n=1 Tax=Spodoptera frugiperda TaxID=7108 RepID=A0A2H1V4H0_SPOFR